MQVHAFVFQRPPQPLDEDVVEEPAFPIHRDAHAGPAQAVRPGKRRELATLIGIHDLGRAELVNGLVQRLNAEIDLQRVRDAPGQDLAGVPVHDGDQTQEPAPHG